MDTKEQARDRIAEIIFRSGVFYFTEFEMVEKILSYLRESGWYHLDDEIGGVVDEECKNHHADESCEHCDNGYTINDDTSWACATEGKVTRPRTLRDVVGKGE